MSIQKPHDSIDLLLSPVALALDARLEELGALDVADLVRRVTWETNSQPRTTEDAGRAIAALATYLIDTHGWEVSSDSRGLRLHHGEHDIVLGVPANVAEYVRTAGGRIPSARNDESLPA